MPFFSTFVFLSSCPCVFSHEGGLPFCARSVRAAVFSLTCLSYPRSVVFLRYFLSLGVIATLFVSLLTPCLLNWAHFKFRGFVCSCAFYPAVLLTYTCGLSDSAYPGLCVSCRVGADAIAVSSISYPPMCVCTLPGLLTGCHALAQVDTTHDSGLSSAGLICCYAMSPRHVDARSLVIHPPLAWQLGSLTCILSWPSS